MIPRCSLRARPRASTPGARAAARSAPARTALAALAAVAAFGSLSALAPRAARAAGSGGLEGTLVETPTQKQVAGRVDVACGALRRTAYTDAAGQFRLRGLPAGSCTLAASGASFVPVTIPVVIQQDAIAAVLVSVTSRAYAAELRRQQQAQERERRQWNRAVRRRAVAVDEMRAMDGVALGGAAGAAEPPRPAPRPEAMAPRPKQAPPPPPAAAAAGSAAAPPRPPAGGRALAAANVIALDRAPAREAEQARREDVQRKRALRDARMDRDIAQQRARNASAGWAVVRVFPVPEYAQAPEGPRTDFRETVYWNPLVETDARGAAEVAFVLSDAVTAFRARAEGFSAQGTPGAGEATISSRLPLTVDAKLPTEVTAGDRVQLPITLSNETDAPLEAALAARFGAALRLASAAPAALRLAPKSKQTVLFALEVVAGSGDADVELRLTAPGFRDDVRRKIRVVPRGFPIETSLSGTARSGAPARHEVDLAGALPGSIRATVTMYPSPVAAIATGMDGMIREPGGCFEQASSTNYPNVMILAYLDSTATGRDAALAGKTKAVLDRGYKLLTGYETKEKGYEWFGNTPGHEALTAYGLMQFADMAKVHPVDPGMVERTAAWLLARRDQQGGFLRSAQALDSFGRASPTTTNAYIMWALAEAARAAPLTRELAVQQQLGRDTRDPYLLALATNTALVTAPKAPDTAAMARRLASLQGKEGNFPGSKETITMSGGQSLEIETAALGVLALIKATKAGAGDFEAQIRAGAQYLNGTRGGYGAWGNTQATILGLKALTAYADHARQIATGGAATLVINGQAAGTLRFERGRRDALVWGDLASKLRPGRNAIELRLEGGATLPYSVAIEHRSASPASSPQAKVAVTASLLRTRAKLGEGVTLRARVENRTAAGIPMTLARIGIPGGTVFQTWQLQELRDKGAIDFYETRPREVILYWRALPPSAKREVDLNLLASVPGRYEAPATSAYLYYTAEDKAWAAPVGIEIE
jgi:hypothetical protein